MILKKGSSLSTEELNCRLSLTENYFKQFLSVQADIDKLNQGADTSSSEAITAEVEDAFVATKAKIMSLLKKRKLSLVDVNATNTTSLLPGPRSHREVKLPKFEGKYSEFPKFIALFNKLINQDEMLDDCERFLILKEHLGSKPLAAIDDFDVTEDNYPKALDRLKECFDKKALINVLNAANAHLNAMLSLGDYKDIANAMLIHLVMERVDDDSQVKWEESVDYRKLSTWNECSAVLTRRCENLEAREHKVNQVNSKAVNYQKEYRNNRNYKFRKLSLKERFIVARRIKVCFTCLKRGHLQKECSAVKCSKCNLSHHQLLHKDYILEPNEQRCKNWPSTSTQETAQSSVMNVMTENEVFLATAVVMVADKFGKYHQMRAILDSGSQMLAVLETL
ncbi:uncharacterized protein LOC119664535 [Teleopsis dalmanni]|uniref:uncharacterized protein LOC119664535 n=1 Tax=Teleopsis dalmanni TaxID=139649 RepID=UPI0018CE1DE7|nr:uncharacterized protein LOC119664535 [Teleopsis dalmanni]